MSPITTATITAHSLGRRISPNLRISIAYHQAVELLIAQAKIQNLPDSAQRRPENLPSRPQADFFLTSPRNRFLPPQPIDPKDRIIIHLRRQRTPRHCPLIGSVTGCVAVITASACGVLGWVHAKNPRPEGASAHDFGSASNHRNVPRITPRPDRQGARTTGRFGCAGGLLVDHRTGCCAGEDGRQGDGQKGIGVLPADRGHA